VLGAAGATDSAPPHLAAAAVHASAGGVPKPVRLGAVGRVRHTGLLNGVIPGSSAAAAAVNLYSGGAGALAQPQIWSLHALCWHDAQPL
jgi:hypothetical protein